MGGRAWSWPWSEAGAVQAADAAGLAQHSGATHGLSSAGGRRWIPLGISSWDLLFVLCWSDVSRCSGSKRKQKADSDAVRAGRKLCLQEGISRTL